MSAILSIRKSDYEALVSAVTELRNAALTVHAEREKLRAERDDLIRENESLHDTHDLLLAARAKVAELERDLERYRALLLRWCMSDMMFTEIDQLEVESRAALKEKL